MSEMEGRSAEVIDDLQSRLAFQEDTIQALNQTVAGQAGELALLHNQVQHLNEKLNELANTVDTLDQPGAIESDEPPPHY